MSQYFTKQKLDYTTKVETGVVTFFPGTCQRNLKKAKAFSKVIKLPVIKLFNTSNLPIGYAVSN